MKKPIRLVIPIAFAALLVGCTRGVEMKMAVDVLSEPEKATVTYKGKVIGETPKSLNVKTFEEISSITSPGSAVFRWAEEYRKSDLEVVTSPEVRDVIERRGIELVSVADAFRT